VAASPERVQRGANPTRQHQYFPGADGVVVLDTVINDDFVHRFQASELDYVQVLPQFRRADELDAEAAYYSHRAHETRAGPELLLLRRTAPVPGYRPVRDGRSGYGLGTKRRDE
jgi:hypothetical protein